MSEYLDHCLRWEPLAEFCFENHRKINEHLYCLCSRVSIKDIVISYYRKNEEVSESDLEDLNNSPSQDLEDQSQVHFSFDTFKVKCEKDDGASCYCSASHTDNCCSTDEQDPAHNFVTISNTLQPSDSGADLTYADSHSDFVQCKLQDTYSPYVSECDPNTSESNEDYLAENTWEKFWSLNGERLIWSSWIQKYSDYINPSYLDENNELVMDENNIPKPVEPIENVDETYDKEITTDEGVRERKYSYDSKINPYKKPCSPKAIGKKDDVDFNTDKIETWSSIGRRRTCSEHDRMYSPRTIEATDSMTNVTKMTLSSYDITSSHLSESTPTDDYSVSSSASEDHSNDLTKVINIHETIDQISLDETVDTEQYWQLLWKKHFGDQYALHYTNYIQSHESKTLPVLNTETEPIRESVTDVECESSESNSQEPLTVMEIKDRVEKLMRKENAEKMKKNDPKSKFAYISSVGVLLQNLLNEEQKDNEPCDGGEKKCENTNQKSVDKSGEYTKKSNIQYSHTSSSKPCYYDDDEDDDDPPEEKSISLKRSHQIDEDEMSRKIEDTFDIMGLCLRPGRMPRGEIVYRKKYGRLRPPNLRQSVSSQKLYFDDDGNPFQRQDSSELDINTDEEDSKTKSVPVIKVNKESFNSNNVPNKKYETLDAANVPLPNDDSSLSETQDNSDDDPTGNVLSVRDSNDKSPLESTKRRRRTKRSTKLNSNATDNSNMPKEIRGNPKMKKYWKKRHSLFHRFDEGIRLDLESWFSVTPENVARHIATKCRHDIVLDAFCGAGGNTIQFAKRCKKVIAVDIDPVKIEMAKHNATVYGVADRIEFIVGDFFALAPYLKADMVFLSPPWGGPSYSQNYEYDLETMLQPKPASVLMKTAQKISPNITFYLPKNSRTDQILALGQGMCESVEIEQNYLDRRFVAITVYF